MTGFITAGFLSAWLQWKNWAANASSEQNNSGIPKQQQQQQQEAGKGACPGQALPPPHPSMLHATLLPTGAFSCSPEHSAEEYLDLLGPTIKQTSETLCACFALRVVSRQAFWG